MMLTLRLWPTAGAPSSWSHPRDGPTFVQWRSRLLHCAMGAWSISARRRSADLLRRDQRRLADAYGQLDDPDPKVARQKAAAWEQKFKNSIYYQKYVVDRQQKLPQVQQRASVTAPQRGPKVNVLQQFLVLTRRYMDLVLRDKLLLTVLMAVMPIIGALVLLVSQSNGWWATRSWRSSANWRRAGGWGGSATYSIIYDSQVMLFILALASVCWIVRLGLRGRQRIIGLPAGTHGHAAHRALPRLEGGGVGPLCPDPVFPVLLVISFKVKLPWDGISPAPLEIYITWCGDLSGDDVGPPDLCQRANTNTVITSSSWCFLPVDLCRVLFDLPGITRPLSTLTLKRWSMEGLGASTASRS